MRNYQAGVCTSCAPVLSKDTDTFRGLKRQGSELKRRKKINPEPKRVNFDHYGDLIKQNEWLHGNVFDAMGNYLFCCKCVHIALGVSYQRLSRQRKIKQAESKEPLRSMTKAEVVTERLSNYVVMPPECDVSFMAWWKQRKDGDVLYVRYPHHRHGLEGRSSSSAKCSIEKDFLEFADQNCQPNGRSVDSGHATHCFLPKFQTIQTPKQGVRNYKERVKRSLVGEFNRAQSESGRGTAFKLFCLRVA